MTVSVIIPAYNRIKQTLKTVDLVISSYVKDYQMEVIVTDCSPDDKLKQALTKKFNNKIIYTRPTKPGISTNKNQGAKKAKGEILIFCDSDIEVENETIHNTLQAFKQHPRGAGVGGLVIWKGGKKDGEVDRPEKNDRIFKYKNTSYIEVIYSRYFATYKDIFHKVGGYDEVLFNMRGEGADLSTRYWRAGFPLVYNKLIKVFHRYNLNDSQATRTPYPQQDIAKDFLILAYKYNMHEKPYPHFSLVMHRYFKQFGINNQAEFLKGILKHLDLIASVKPYLDENKLKNDLYDFKFLEVFSNKKLLRECLNL
ncbi:MAG: glycosyltransferase family 2 protein [Candidatus Roizmanbacteria bacterium]|nr:MAG: glycosyltransferase family 2 protein [Candidatus Roizmanbacteria bacterium]